MTRARWAVAAAVGVLVGGAGCVSCETRSARASWETAPACETPPCDRQHVYAILVNGACPTGSPSLESLRDGLAARGYAKSYFGQIVHAFWLASEMRAVAQCDPSARFVVVGADVAAPVAAHLARSAAADGLNVDALVLLDPVMGRDSVGCPGRTVLVTSGGPCDVAHTERATIPGTTRLTLAGHAGTIDLMVALLKSSAMRVEHPEVIEDEWPADARPPRNLTPPAGAEGEWLFLYDTPGYHPAPLSAPNAGPIAPALVPPHGYPAPPQLPRPQMVPWLRPNPPVVPAPAVPLPLPRQSGDAP